MPIRFGVNLYLLLYKIKTFQFLTELHRVKIWSVIFVAKFDISSSSRLRLRLKLLNGVVMKILHFTFKILHGAAKLK